MNLFKVADGGLKAAAKILLCLPAYFEAHMRISSLPNVPKLD